MRRNLVAVASTLALVRTAVGHPEVDLEQRILTALEVDTARFIDLTTPSLEQWFELVAGPYTFELHRAPVRAHEADAYVQTASGEFVRFDLPPVRTYRGTIRELPGSEVAASVTRAGLSAVVVPLEGAIRCIHPASAVVPDAPDRLHVEYATGLSGEQWACGVDASASLAVGASFGPRQACPEVAEIAFDADIEFFHLNGSDAGEVITDIEMVLNGVNLIFERDAGVTHASTSYLVRTAEPDPYTSADADSLLNQLRVEWVYRQSGIVRDLAHLMTGRNLTGAIIGTAVQDGMCTADGFGLSQSRFTANLGYRIGLTAHQLGHNWTAVHCDDEWWTCRLMCSNLGGCRNDVTSFGDASINSIVYHRVRSSCLDAGVGAPPIANDDELAVFFQTPTRLDVQVNDTVECGERTLIPLVFFTPAGGMVTDSAGTGPGGRDELFYRPPDVASGNGFIGMDSFNYLLVNGAQSSLASVSIDVRGPLPAENPGATESGIATSYYELTGPERLPDFDSLVPLSSEILDEIMIASVTGEVLGSGRADDVGVVYEGLVTVPETATYTFTLASDEGSRLHVGGEVVVDNDGLHAHLEVDGQIPLEAGAHHIRIEYFEATGLASLVASIAGGPFTEQPIDPAMLSHVVSLCEADWNNDDILSSSDLLAYINDYNRVRAGGRPAYRDPDLAVPHGVINSADFIAFVSAYAAGCP